MLADDLPVSDVARILKCWHGAGRGRQCSWSEPKLRFGLYWSKLAWGARTKRGNTMDRRSFLIGLLGLAAAPAMIAVPSASPASAAPLLHQPAPEPASRSGEAEVDLEKVESDWSQWRYRHRRRVYRRVYRRGYRRAYRRRFY